MITETGYVFIVMCRWEAEIGLVIMAVYKAKVVLSFILPVPERNRRLFQSAQCVEGQTRC
jgi:hypothetical protein